MWTIETKKYAKYISVKNDFQKYKNKKTPHPVADQLATILGWPWRSMSLPLRSPLRLSGGMKPSSLAWLTMKPLNILLLVRHWHVMLFIYIDYSFISLYVMYVYGWIYCIEFNVWSGYTLDVPAFKYRFPTVIDMLPIELFRFRFPVHSISFSRPSSPFSIPIPE